MGDVKKNSTTGGGLKHGRKVWRCFRRWKMLFLSMITTWLCSLPSSQVAGRERVDCCCGKMAVHPISAGETSPAEQKYASALHSTASWATHPIPMSEEFNPDRNQYRYSIISIQNQIVILRFIKKKKKNYQSLFQKLIIVHWRGGIEGGEHGLLSNDF